VRVVVLSVSFPQRLDVAAHAELNEVRVDQRAESFRIFAGRLDRKPLGQLQCVRPEEMDRSEISGGEESAEQTPLRVGVRLAVTESENDGNDDVRIEVMADWQVTFQLAVVERLRQRRRERRKLSR
jgi:hypothetical protein